MLKISLLISILCLINPVSSRDYRTYRVKKNDTLYGIARKFKVNPDKISRTRDNKKALMVGELLKIPREELIVKGVFKYPTISRPNIIKNYSSAPSNPFKGVIVKNRNSMNVFPSAKGQVVAVDFLKGYEKYIIMKHENGYTTVYANMEKIFVKEGQTVDRKEKLGKYKQDKGLYFQLNKNEESVNPLEYIK